jgi:hypothetical protein
MGTQLTVTNQLETAVLDIVQSMELFLCHTLLQALI